MFEVNVTVSIQNYDPANDEIIPYLNAMFDITLEFIKTSLPLLIRYATEPSYAF